MRRLLLIPVLAALLLAIPTPAYAQPCRPGAFDQADMAGVYVSPASQMRLTIYECGGTIVLWQNEFGMHRAGYLGNERTPEGGYIARIAVPDPVVSSLDGRTTLWVKPAEPGWIQAVTVSPFGDDIKVYRLQKV